MCWPSLGEPFLAQLNASQPPSQLSLATTLINELAQEQQEIALVLDDYQVVENPLLHQGIIFLVERAPAYFHVLLASRVDPALPLARWRFRGLLGELRAPELRLNTAEAAHDVQHVAGQVLSEETLTRLLEHTEGWIAGLQLAALSLRDQADPASILTAWSGTQRFLLDYTQEEILARQAPARRRKRLRADLCQTVLREPDSQSGSLSKWNAQTSSWLRWMKSTSGFASTLWFTEHEQLHEAIPHFLTAHDYPPQSNCSVA